MKGKLHKSMNYGWMVQDKVDSFYPLYPYDLFTNSIERVEGKEVDFTLVYSWNEQEEKLIEVAIIVDVYSSELSKEISDDEIEKWAKEYTCNEYEKLIFDYENYDEYRDFVNGAKKYREQLKNKKD
jgi:hypothetical protein